MKTQTKEFFSQFESIIFNGKYFEFTFDLKKIKHRGDYDIANNKLPEKVKWTVCSCVERSKYKKASSDEGKPKENENNQDTSQKTNKVFNVNDELKKLLSEADILQENNDLKSLIQNEMSLS